MILALNLILALLLQAPVAPAPQAPPSTLVVVGLLDGQKLALDNPKFTGFIESRESGGAVLLYRQKDFRGELKLSEIQRIDLGYKKGKPLPLSITLKSGDKINVESDRRDFLTLKGATEKGPVTVQHPDPTSKLLELPRRAPNRKHALTIQYLEFPQ